MATRAGTIVVNDNKTGLVTWTGLLNGDDGEGVLVGRWSDKTIQVVGTFGAGGDVDLEGSLDGGVTFGQLHDAQGTVVSIGDSLPLLVAENPLLIRPNIAGGDGSTDLTVHIFFVVR